MTALWSGTRKKGGKYLFARHTQMRVKSDDLDFDCWSMHLSLYNHVKSYFFIDLFVVFPLYLCMVILLLLWCVRWKKTVTSFFARTTALEDITSSTRKKINKEEDIIRLLPATLGCPVSTVLTSNHHFLIALETPQIVCMIYVRLGWVFFFIAIRMSHRFFILPPPSPLRFYLFLPCPTLL